MSARDQQAPDGAAAVRQQMEELQLAVQARQAMIYSRADPSAESDALRELLEMQAELYRLEERF